MNISETFSVYRGGTNASISKGTIRFTLRISHLSTLHLDTIGDVPMAAGLTTDLSIAETPVCVHGASDGRDGINR